jgi:hypothetical protein
MPNKGSKMLINEPPLMFQPSLAKKTSVNEAIALQQLHYWLLLNADKPDHIKDGRVWCWNTYEEWQKNNFPFWSISTIKRAFSDLESRGLIIKGRFNKLSFDRTGWYTIDYDALDRLSSGQVDPIDELKLTPSSGQDDRTIPETTTETTYIPAAPKNKAETECSIPAGMNERTAKAMTFDCTFCGSKAVITWQNVLCPVDGCSARIKWQGNKWLDKVLAARSKDAKAAAKRTEQQERMKQEPALAFFMIQFPNVYISPDYEKAILDCAARIGLDTFKTQADAIRLADQHKHMTPQGIARHIINSLPYWGNNTPSQKPIKEVSTYDFTN